MRKDKLSVEQILDTIALMFPNAKAELNHSDSYQLIVAVILSAQATDVSVNKVTPALFETYPTIYDLAQANRNHVESLIKTIGLYKNKAKAIIRMAQQVVTRFNGEIPATKKQLLTLDGVGVKTANVVLSVWFDQPAIAVDTHVNRVSKRLNLAKPDDDVIKVEQKLKRKIKRERWSHAHHLFIFFGRYHCKAVNPNCDNCPFIHQCQYIKAKAA